MKIIKTIPGQGIYFKEDTVETGTEKATTERNVINIYDDVKYQKILGFGRRQCRCGSSPRSCWVVFWDWTVG